MNREQRHERASRKVEAALFFAQKKLEEHDLMYNGIIDNGLSQEIIERMRVSSETDLETWKYIKDRINE